MFHPAVKRFRAQHVSIFAHSPSQNCTNVGDAPGSQGYVVMQQDPHAQHVSSEQVPESALCSRQQAAANLIRATNNVAAFVRALGSFLQGDFWGSHVALETMDFEQVQ